METWLQNGIYWHLNGEDYMTIKKDMRLVKCERVGMLKKMRGLS